MKKIIGISGLAGDGKDSVCRILQKFFKENSDFVVERLALADNLKMDCQQACLELFNIDPIECSRENKNKIRDFLVFYGKVMRSKTKGSYWTNLIDEKIENTNKENLIFCVPDIRYAQYENDEVQWLKTYEKSFHIHVKKHSIKYDSNSGRLVKIFSDPINSEESLNDPIVESYADYVLEWIDSSPVLPEKDDWCLKSVHYIAQDILDTLKRQDDTEIIKKQ